MSNMVQLLSFFVNMGEEYVCEILFTRISIQSCKNKSPIHTSLLFIYLCTPAIHTGGIMVLVMKNKIPFTHQRRYCSTYHKALLPMRFCIGCHMGFQRRKAPWLSEDAPNLAF